MREFTPLAVILGVIIGIVFGAANAYVGLKVGMTVSASIPAAVIAMGVFSGLLRRRSVLESNIVQTIGSVGESLAAGMVFVIPALYMIAANGDSGVQPPRVWEMALWGGAGGVLGVLFMIPLRRMLIVREHGKLPYPEGTACAEVLNSGDEGGAAARCVFWGLGIGALYELFRSLGFWANAAKQRLPLINTQAGVDVSPALLGVGYILGVRVAGYMLAGATLGWFVIIPAIAFFGQHGADPVFPAKTPIADMTPDALWSSYVRYIGAGAVVLGGLVSLFRSLGVIGRSLLHLFGGGGTGERTDRDIPTVILLLLLAGVGVGVWALAGAGYMNPLFRLVPVIACVIGFGFFFVTVSSRLVGIVGSSSNPASGMTIAAILGTALIVVAFAGRLGLDPAMQKVAILSVGALVCIAVCIAGDTSQDLKTGFLVRATPWKQQVGELLGVTTAAAALAGILWLIGQQYGYADPSAAETPPHALPAYQAGIMKLVVEGVVDQQLPWNFILIGMASALVVEFLGLPALPFAVGLYLPFELSSAIMIGALVRWLVDRARRSRPETRNPGVLAASGLVAGHGVAGVALVGVAAFIGWFWDDPRFTPPTFDNAGQTWTVVAPPQEQIVDAADAALTEQKSGEPVIPGHLFPWLTTQTSLVEMEYGLRPHRLEAGAFRGENAVDWYQLLPMGPFLLLALWLLIVGLRRLPEPPSVIAERLRPKPEPMPPATRAAAIPLISDDEAAQLKRSEKQQRTPMFTEHTRKESDPPPTPPGDAC